MYPPMSRVPALVGDPWWLPYERVLLAHLTHSLSNYVSISYLPAEHWVNAAFGCTVTEKRFAIWGIANNNAQKAHAATYVSYRFPAAAGVERSRTGQRVVSRNAAPASWLWLCVAVAALTQWGIGQICTSSPRSLTPAISCEIWKDFSSRSDSPSLCRADLCCRGGRTLVLIFAGAWAEG